MVLFDDVVAMTTEQLDKSVLLLSLFWTLQSKCMSLDITTWTLLNCALAAFARAATSTKIFFGRPRTVPCD